MGREGEKETGRSCRRENKRQKRGKSRREEESEKIVGNEVQEEKKQ